MNSPSVKTVVFDQSEGESAGVVVPFVIDNDLDSQAAAFEQRAMTLADFEPLGLTSNPTIAELVATTQKAPKLVQWVEDNVPQGLAVFSLPEEHRKRMRTTNMLERQNRELKRRTRVATLFPNEASLLRLVTAVLVEVSDDWETGPMSYLTFKEQQ